MRNSNSPSLEKALAQELRGIALHIADTDAAQYGVESLADKKKVKEHDLWTLNKIADLFENFFSSKAATDTN